MKQFVWILILMFITVLGTFVYGITKRLSHEDLVMICVLGVTMGIGLPVTIAFSFAIGRMTSPRKAESESQQVYYGQGQGRMMAQQPPVIIVPQGGIYPSPQLMASTWDATPGPRQYTVVGGESLSE